VVKTVYLLFGVDGYLKEKALEDYKKRLLPKASASFNYHLFYGDSANAKEIIDSASTLPFLSPRRLVAVKRFEKLRMQERAALRTYIPHASPSTCLVFETADEKILRELSSETRYIEVNRVDEYKERSLSENLREVLSASGKTIEIKAVALLRERIGDDIEHLRKETEKIATFVGSRKNITVEDVEIMVEKELVDSTFALADAIGKKSAKKALTIIAELTSSGRKHHEIVGVLSWHLRRLLKAKILIRSGAGNEEMLTALKVGRRFREEFMSQVRGSKLDELKKKIDVLLLSDIDMKTSRVDPKVSLELAVIRLCF